MSKENKWKGWCSACKYLDLSEKTKGGVSIWKCTHEEVKKKKNPNKNHNYSRNCEYWEEKDD